jgi:hypothetical protein
MPKPMSDKYYEEKFEFPMWQMIKKRAEEKDISYRKAAHEVIPEYVKTIRFRDTEFEDAAVKKRAKEIAELVKRAREQKKKEGTRTHTRQIM